MAENDGLESLTSEILECISCITLALHAELSTRYSMTRLKKPRLSTANSPIKVYKSYLKSKYLGQKMPNYGKWPNLPSKKYINLTVIEKAERAILDYSSALVYGNIQAVKRKSDISFQDVAKHDENGILPRFVLVEGAPGVGKSTFAWEACRRWAEGEILEDFELVILIKLRDDSIRKATCLGDLIQYPRDPAIRQAVIDEITKSGGKGVLLLLEGYDELPALQDEASLVRQVINGNQFDAGTVLVTSRHWASQPFLLPTNTSRPVSQHIEILGFTGENIKDYVSSMLEKEPSLLKDFLQYLEICPHIRSMMYIPLNCAIVVDVYRHSKKENTIIPKTTTELYLSLTQSLLLRHTYPEYESITLVDLPLSIKRNFDNLTKLAYKGICLNQQQVIFTEEELPCGLDTLGFMQSSMELYVDEGAKKSFNFLHLTIQEFLAAYHIFSHHSSDSQVEAFNDKDEGMVSTFLAGLSPSSLLVSLDRNRRSFEDKDIYRLFEAQGRVKPPYEVCEGLPTNPFYSYMLGYLIANSSCPWEAIIEGTKEAINLFVIGLSVCGDRHCRAKLVKVTEVSEIVGLSKANLALEKLQFDFSPYEQKHAADICLFFDNLSSGSPLSFKHFILSRFHFTNEETKKFKSYLVMCSIIKSLTLTHCKFESNAAAILMDGVKACSSLEKLTIVLSDNWCDAVCEMLTGNKNLKELDVEYFEDHNVCALIHALHLNHTLEKLTIKRKLWVFLTSFENKSVHIVRNSAPLIFQSSILQKHSRVSSEIAKMLIQNKSLKELDVCNCELDLQGDIGTVLCENRTLRRLSISVERGPELEAISELLKRNKTLKVLQLVLNVEGASTIAEVMCENNTLEELHIVGKIGAHEAFATMLKRNTSLRKLSMAWTKDAEHCNRTWDEEFATLSNALSQNKSLQQLKVYDPGLSELQLETRRKYEDARIQCTDSVQDIIILSL